MVYFLFLINVNMDVDNSAATDNPSSFSSSLLRKRTSPLSKKKGGINKRESMIILPPSLPIDKAQGYLVAPPFNDCCDEENEEEMELFYGPLLNTSNTRLTLMDEMIILGMNESSGNLPLLNDRLSFALRGSLLIEMSLRGMIDVVRPKDSSSFMDYLVVPCNKEAKAPNLHRESLLEEALRTMVAIQRETVNPPQLLSIHTWISLLSGDSWIPTICPTTKDFLKRPQSIKRIQLTEFRERLSKGLVDKGILSSSKRTIFPFIDISTHPLRSGRSKEFIVQRFLAVIRHGSYCSFNNTSNNNNNNNNNNIANITSIASTSIGSSPLYKVQKANVNLRTIAMVLCSSAGDVIGDGLARVLGSKAKEDCLKRLDMISNLYQNPPPPPPQQKEQQSSTSFLIAGVLEYFEKVLSFI